MKKVLFTATVDSHILNFHTPFLKYFKDRGYEVHVATDGTEEIPYCDVKHTVSFERSPFKINNLKAIKQLKEIIDTEGFEIIHTHTPMGSVVTRLAALRARKQHKTRVIYTAHGFHFYKGAPLQNWLLFYPVERILSRYTDTLITINQEDYQRAKKQFKTRVEYVPGVGIDEEKFNFKMTKKEKSELRNSLGIKDTDFVFIYAAELNKNKNQKMLIEAMREVVKTNNNIHVLLPGKDSYNGYHQQLINEYKLDNNIHLLGHRKDVPRLLKVSDAAVSTSLREGLPVNILEAIHIGLPIIATNCRGNQDLVKHLDNGLLIDNYDVTSVEKSILLAANMFKPSTVRIIKNDIHTVKSIITTVDAIYSKSRIIHLLSTDKFGGAEHVAINIISHTPQGYTAHYCSPPGPINVVLEDNGIEHIEIRKLSYFELRRIILQNRPDIIHAHDFKASMLASFFSNRSKLISHIHQDPKWLDSKASLNKFAYGMRLERYNKIVLVSSSIRKRAIFSKVSPDRLVVIDNSIDAKSILKKSKAPVREVFDVGFCGRLEEVKQPLEFIQLINDLKISHRDIKAVMIGDGSLANECKKLIDELDLALNINLVGFQENPYKYIRSCKFIISTSLSEGFGLVAVEATYLGALVVAYKNSGISSIFGEGSKILCDSRKQMIDTYNSLNMSNDLYVSQLGLSRVRIKRYLKTGSALKEDYCTLVLKAL